MTFGEYLNRATSLSLSEGEVWDLFCRAVRVVAEIPATHPLERQSLLADLGLDAFAVVEVLCEIEDLLGVELRMHPLEPIAHPAQLTTLDDMLGFLHFGH